MPPMVPAAPSKATRAQSPVLLVGLKAPAFRARPGTHRLRPPTGSRALDGDARYGPFL
jgi:hypothetical protein